ncbi:unnamed protein product, partial [Sphacelaria rigidula]
LSRQALADAVSKARHYVFPDAEGNNALDPRLLLVEFNSSILLHHSQVALIGRFMSKATNGLSMCHQMIMGAGKTTVVAPTLGLLLADGTRLVMEVRKLNV